MANSTLHEKFSSFLLCLLLGYFGVHRFYEGNTKLGAIYLCTFGLCGIGWAFDCFVRLFGLIICITKVCSSNAKQKTAAPAALNIIQHEQPTNEIKDEKPTTVSLSPSQSQTPTSASVVQPKPIEPVPATVTQTKNTTPTGTLEPRKYVFTSPHKTEPEPAFSSFEYTDALKDALKNSIKIEVSTTSHMVELRQETPGMLPMADIGGYVSPSGGFVNYAMYIVSGKNSDTGRKSKKKYSGRSEEEVKAKAIADGLTEPLTAEVVPMDEPTERQISYALDLEATLPEGLCKNDISSIISRITEHDEAAPYPPLSRYAHDIGIYFSRFIGERALFDTLIYQLEDIDRVTFYAYCVYRQERGGRIGDPRELPFYAALRATGEKVSMNPDLMKNLKERSVYDYEHPHRGTKIYKAVAASLKEACIL